MLRILHRLTRAGLLITLSAAAASAQHHYLLQAPTGNVKDICARHNLQYVTALTGSAKGMYICNSGLSLAVVSQLLAHETDIKGVEEDLPLALPETSKNVLPSGPVRPSTSWASQGVKQAGNSVDDIGDGNKYWSAYVDQPAAGAIKIKQAHGIAIGAGIVAVLDTGVDFGNSVLHNSLIWGYDYINNIPGGQTLPVDLNQSTTSILDQSTTSILDQSTTSILDVNTTIVLDQSTTSILDQSTTSILDTAGTKPINDWGHGTMVAGLIHLVAPNAKIMPVKVFDAKGGSSISLLVQGIHYAVDSGARVINMSFDSVGFSQALKEAIDYANSHGVILVAAAGNEGRSMTVYPCSFTGVIGVGAVDSNNNRASFSNYGTSVDLAAPGVWVITTYPGNKWAAGSGTSFSAPFVSGLGALLNELQSSINSVQAQAAANHAHPLPGQQLGAGELDLFLALNSVHP